MLYNYYHSAPLGDPLSDTVIEVRDEQGRAISSGTGTVFIGKMNHLYMPYKGVVLGWTGMHKA